MEMANDWVYEFKNTIPYFWGGLEEDEPEYVEETKRLMVKYEISIEEIVYIDHELVASFYTFPLMCVIDRHTGKEAKEILEKLISRGIIIELTEKQIKRYQITDDIEYDKQYGIRYFKPPRNWTRKIKNILPDWS